MTANKKYIVLEKNGAEHEFALKHGTDFYRQKTKMDVELGTDADGFTVLSYQGKQYQVEVAAQSQNRFEILLNGVSYKFSVETPFSLFRHKLLASQRNRSNKVNVKAPIPGKVLDVMVEKGQVVTEDTPLLVLEAMKMQNTITASAKGTVTKVQVKPGKVVGKDELLVEISR